MTAPDRIYRGVTVGGRVVYQDSPPSDDQLVWPWEAYTRANPLAEALAVPEVRALVEALRDLFGAVCGDTGFAQCVRDHSGTAYPWPALDLAEEHARAALRAIAAAKGDTEIPADAENGRATVSRITKGDVSQSSAD